MTADRPLVLATGEIIIFEIPTKLEKGCEHRISVKVQGNGKYIFLTLLLIDPSGKQQWWADNDSIDLVKNGGKIELKDNSEYENTWYFPVFNDAIAGDYIAVLGMYQDTYGLPVENRRLIDYWIKKLEVVEAKSASQETGFKVAGIKTEEEEFEILRDRILWCICNNLLSNNRRTFHAADMISDCARAFYNEKEIEQYKITGEHEYYKPVLEKIYKPLVERGLIVEYKKNNFRIPEGSKLEKICKSSENKAYMRWNEIDWG